MSLSSLVPAAMVMNLPMIVGAHTIDEVQVALNWASSSVESYCERQFAFVAADTVFVDPHRGNGGRSQAMLPNPPVSNVSNVMALMPGNGTLTWVPLTNYAWAGDGLLYDTTRFFGLNGVSGSTFWSGVFNADGAFDFNNIPSWPFLPRSLQVTYDHGFILPDTTGPTTAPNLPQGVIDAVIKGASFYLDNASGAIENRVGELTTRYEPNMTSGWLDEKLLGNFRMVYP